MKNLTKLYFVCVIFLLILSIANTSRSSSSQKCFDEKLRGIESTIDIFSDDINEMREEIGHLSLAVAKLVDHFKIKSSSLIENNKKRNAKSSSGRNNAVSPDNSVTSQTYRRDSNSSSKYFW